MPEIKKVHEKSVLVNVYAGSADTKVRMQLDNSDWYNLERTDMVDPFVQHIVMMNKIKAYPTHFSRKAALRLSDSDHIWQGELPDGLSKGTHILRIEATEPSGFNVVENTIIYID